MTNSLSNKLKISLSFTTEIVRLRVPPGLIPLSQGKDRSMICYTSLIADMRDITKNQNYSFVLFIRFHLRTLKVGFFSFAKWMELIGTLSI